MENGFMRLNKFLAKAGIASRRKADTMIADGRVFLNGKKVDTQGVLVNPEVDSIEVDGLLVTAIDEKIYIALNKPIGYTTTREDIHAEKTVYELLPDEYRTIVHPVGRLDKDSEGLLIFTNDGDLTYTLTHPKFEHEKEYIVVVKGILTSSDIEQLITGIDIGDRITAQAEIGEVIENKDTTQIHITIREGANRQIRRMFECLGKPVISLLRVREGMYRVGDLKSGEFILIKKEDILPE